MAFEEALYDVFGPGRADRGMSISDYAPAFGEEELLAVQAQLPRLTGRVPISVGPTGVYGRLLADAGRRQAAQAVAAGDVASLARSRKRKAMTDAAIQLGRDKRAADSATFQQQARTRGNIAAAFGEGIESTRAAIENPMFQFAMKGAGERSEQARKRAELDELLSRQPERFAGGFGGTDMQDLYKVPTYSLMLGGDY